MTAYVPRTLKLELQRRGRLPVAEVIEIGLALSAGLAHLHKHRLVHRDIKPSNVIFVNNVPKLADIGLVTDVDATVSSVGTEGYIAPERQGTEQADIYSLGKVLYEISTGKDRQEFPEPPTLLGQFEDRDELLELGEVIKKACERNPKQRYQSGEALHDDLLLLSAGKSVKRMRKAERRLVWLTRAAVAAGALAALGAGGYWFERSQSRRARAVSERETRLRQQLETEHAGTLKLAELMRQNLYVANVQLAQTALRENDFGTAERALLQEVPRPGESDLRGFEWSHFWKQSQGNKLFSWHAHDSPVRSLAVSADGRFLASAAGGDQAKVWDAATYKLLFQITNADCVAFSPDATQLFSTNPGGLVEVWKTGTWERIGSISARRSDTSVQAFPQLAVSPTEPILAVATGCANLWGGSGAVRLYDYNRFAELGILTNSGDRMAFSQDGRSLVTGSCKGNITVWDVESRQAKKIFRKFGDVASLSMSSDGRWLVVCEGWNRTTVRLWDLEEGKELPPLAYFGKTIWKVLFSPDGRTVATSSSDQMLRLWDVTTQTQLATLHGQGALKWALAFSPKGEYLFGGGADGMLAIWSTTITNAKPMTPILRDHRWADVPWFSRDGRNVAVFEEGAMRLWDVDAGEQIAALPEAEYALWFAPDGKELLTLKSNRWLETWDLASRIVSQSVELCSNQLFFDRVTLSLDGRILATASLEDSRHIRLWDTRSGHLKAVMTGTVEVERVDTRQMRLTAGTMAFSPDGRHLASCRNGVDLFDLAKDSAPWSFAAHQSTVNQIAFSPDSDVFATCSDDETVKLWSASRRIEIATFPHDVTVRTIAFSPDGNTLAAGGYDGHINFWSVRAGRQVASLRVGASSLELLTFAPDNRCLAYGDWKSMLFLRCPTLAEIDRQRDAADRVAAGEGLPRNGSRY